MESPQQYYNGLQCVKADDYTDGFLSLGKIRCSIPEHYAVMAISIALVEVREWFNVSGNITDAQIAMTAEMILERYYDYSLGEIKNVLRSKMREGKVYNRIDGNVIMSWLAEYDLKRDNASEDYQQNATKSYESSAGQISHAIYRADLENRAEHGDKRAISILSGYKERERMTRLDTLIKKEIDFRIYKMNYLKNKAAETNEQHNQQKQ